MARGPLASRDPFTQLRREIERLFADVFEGRGFGPPPWWEQHRPAVNVWEDQDSVFVELEVPGVKSENLDLSVMGSELSIKVHYPEEKLEGATYHRRERPVGDFARVLRLPTEVDPAKVEASLENGVLTIKLAKAEAARPRKIAVATR
ncbi:MAG: Hsp20/alpha crystallin family protein [Thermoguttaceae bacterium]|nr:Hsp20/alpha crystallin family protein [Thermoguttaceae bacterium]MDW8079241.1 Hsp20/alpha crystallin family protein [Thermoguttaceae bacterium]